MYSKKTKYTKHSFFMNLALLQAKKVLGNTKDNPAVGCVIVKENCVIHSGSTGFNGRPHAEHNALNFNKKEIRNSDLYVTLEPCIMCAGAIINARIDNIFFGAYDSKYGSVSSIYNLCNDTRLNHQSGVKGGILEKECSSLLTSFFKKEV